MVDETFEGVSQRVGVAKGSRDIAPGPTHHRISYRGGAGPIFRIALVNSLLSLLTLGLYRFWARTRLRRYFWSHVELDGDPIEYTGTGRQLFIGFLLVLAILVPLLFGLEYATALFPQDAWQQIAILLFQGFGLLFLIQYAIFRARRFRLGHTRWRGIRASQTGSAVTYALRAFGYLLLTIVTLGLAYPLFRVRTQRYLMENTRLGDQAFTFGGKAWPLFKIWLPVWGIVCLIMAAIPLNAQFIDLHVLSGRDAPQSFAEVTYGILGGGALIAAIVCLIVSALLYVCYRIGEFWYFTSVTGFGPLSFVSGLKARSALKIYVVYYLVFGVVFVTVGGAIAVALFGPESPVFESWQTESIEERVVQAKVVGLAGTAIALLLALALTSILQPVLITHPFARRIVASLEVEGCYDMEALLQSKKAAGRRGEGLADAFDVDVAGF